MGAVSLAALTLLLGLGSPALAHGADAPDATNYQTKILSTPDVPGLEIRTIEAGARLQLTNRGSADVEVLGYSNEPYLIIKPDGVYQNIHSPATYLNITIAHVDPPATADPTVPPEWQKISDEPTYRWHDQRAIWTDPNPPAEVTAAPDRTHHIRDWSVPMRVEVTPLTLTGSLDWIPAPNPLIWWVTAAVLIGLIALLSLVPRPRAVRLTLCLLTLSAGILTLIYATARELDAGNNTPLPILGQLFSAQLWPTVSALAAIAAAIYTLTRPQASDFALALGAAAVGLFGGMVNAAVFHRSITPTPWPAQTARIMILAIIALGLGSALAAMLRLRGTAPQPVDSAEVL